MTYVPNFNPFTNFNQIMWKKTLWINFLRAVCVLPVLVGFFALNDSLYFEVVPFFLLYTFLYLFLMAPLLIFLDRLVMITFSLTGLPIIGQIINALSALVFISGGDPIVFALSKIKPEIVPVQRYPFINFSVIMFVVKQELV